MGRVQKGIQPGVIFDAESVRGLLTCAQCGVMSVPYPCESCGGTEFTKTQTRRVVKRLKMHDDYGKPVWEEAWVDTGYAQHGSCCLKVPYRGGLAGETSHRHWPRYVQGDIGWVKEPLRSHYRNVVYAADGHTVVHPDTGLPMGWTWQRGRLPGMFMPKVARRLWVQFETPLAQRLQEITEEDAVAEGVFGPPRSGAGWRQYPFESCPLETARESYRTRIVALHSARVWDENWWVWRYPFRRIAPPQEGGLA